MSYSIKINESKPESNILWFGFSFFYEVCSKNINPLSQRSLSSEVVAKQ